MITILDCEKVELLPTLMLSWIEHGSNATIRCAAVMTRVGERKRSVDAGFITSYGGNRVNPCTHLKVDGQVWAVDIPTKDPGPNIFPWAYFYGYLTSHVDDFELEHRQDRETSYKYPFWTDYTAYQHVIDENTVEAGYTCSTHRPTSNTGKYVHTFTSEHYTYTRRLNKPTYWDVMKIDEKGRVTKSTTRSSFKSHKAAHAWVPMADGILNHLPERTSDIDSLLDSCIQQQKLVNVNSLAYLKDFAEIGSMAMSTVKAIKSLDNPKSWADLFLSVKYGWKMTLADTLELSKALGTAVGSAPRKHQRCRASREANGWQEYLSFDVDNSASPGTSLRQLINWGIWPTAENLWDFVPFSFVVNWLTGLNGIMQAIDDNLILCHLPVSHICHSFKYVGTISASSFSTNLLGTLRIQYYQRQILKSLPWKKFKLDSINGLSGHGAEATALIVQRVFHD